MDNSISKILDSRKPAEAANDSSDKFFSILLGEGLQENFLEFQFQDGMRTCFSYSDLLWFNYYPDAGCIDLEFGGFLVKVIGRGLSPKLFNGIKNKRVAWVRESDSEFQDNKENETYIEKITITLPKGFDDKESDMEE